MAETNAKIHVLADETLGGIKREYVEVDRGALEGEKIVIVGKSYTEDVYKTGDIFTVDRDFHSEVNFVESDAATSEGNYSGLIYHDEYRVLEPTDIVHIGTQRYEIVDRKAEVGEKVVHVDGDCGESDGVVTEVTDVGASTVDVVEYEVSDGESVCGISHGYYRVLVPVEATESDEPKPADPIDVIANLAQEVASLKRTVDCHKGEIDTLHRDNRTLGEELARLAAEVGKETEVSAKAMAEAFVALKRAGL
ncbi:hypothetical protein QRX25_14785 [Bacillus sp. L381]|uniref:hypothetical protein n=1 Tax=Bacillus TaxID=1386 RepID=UPI001BACE3E2|nr:MULTISPECIES: hypothetical protein [Bacillus]MCR9040831.1 hypothetical protein [Bacillus velezensis]QUN11500.1 hypothetical protein KEF49_14585 [Bacillus amyloliquefaciens]QYM84574.1 hypothetical protein KTJ85_14430 [Bacillus sp. 7D3]QZY13845.1 hypothetical protein K7B13_14685 [Bacillus amyloliquefaciens]WIX20867.1 hypothetical protein QRX25_14785 [Bacillus sp. L381]